MATEFEIIQRYFTRTVKRAQLGVGDDCALFAPEADAQFAVSTDMLVEGRHFHAGADARGLGHKSLAVNLSDLAAMGAEPRFATLALALPSADPLWLEQFSRGLFELADAFGVELIGGDTTRGPRTISITVIGTVPPGQALRRDGARPGDDLWLSGCTGEAALALAHLEKQIALKPAQLKHCLERLDRPQPRVELGRALRGLASSAIDISDGLLADVGHISERSGVALELLLDSLPCPPALQSCGDARLAQRCLLGGGDDYELAFTAAPETRAKIRAIARRLGIALSRVGTVLAGGAGKVRVLDREAKPVATDTKGFDHFG